MDLTYDKLSPDAAAEHLNSLSHWQIEGGALVKEFKFNRYKDAVLFTTMIAYLAEELNHHPDILLGYGKVIVSMRTHDAGGGLTAYDFELARRIDLIQSL